MCRVFEVEHLHSVVLTFYNTDAAIIQTSYTKRVTKLSRTTSFTTERPDQLAVLLHYVDLVCDPISHDYIALSVECDAIGILRSERTSLSSAKCGFLSAVTAANMAFRYQQR